MLLGEFSRTMGILFSCRILSAAIGDAILLPFVALAFRICIPIMPHVTEFAKPNSSPFGWWVPIWHHTARQIPVDSSPGACTTRERRKP